MGSRTTWLVTLLVLFLLSVGAAVPLTAKLITVRNSWTKKYLGLSTQSQKAREDLARVTSERNLAVNELSFYATEWNNVWPEVNSQISNPGSGTMTIDAGSALGLRERQRLYGFELTADGQSIYRGDFIVQRVSETQAILAPFWRLRPGEVQTWQPGRWRWRALIPSGWQTRYDDLEAQLVKLDELFADRQHQLKVQDRLVADGEAAVARREAEMLGGADLPKDKTFPVEESQGLVSALEVLEDQRNNELIEVDRLRRTLLEMKQSQQNIIDEIRALSRRLPGATPAPEAEVSSVR